MIPPDSTLDRLRRAIPEETRDYGYAWVSAAVMFLMAFGIVTGEEAALWTQLGVALVTCTYALIYSPSMWRASLYLTVGPVGAVLLAYGLVSDERWAIIVAAVGQALGITTAAVASGRPAPYPAQTSDLNAAAMPLLNAAHGKATQRA